MASRRSDDTFRSARIFQLNRGIRGTVGQDDRVDFYKFTASSQIDLSLTLSGLTANVRMRLLNARRSSIAISDLSSFQSEQIFTALDPGTYYIQVQLRGLRGNTRYSLRAAASPAEPGETPSTARNLGILAGEVRFSESVSNSDRLDYYKFTLPQISTINVNIDGLSSSAFAELHFDANNNGLIDQGERLDSGSDSNTIARTVLPGTYFLEVNTLFGPSGQYNLSIAAAPDPSNLTTDPGNAATTAFNFSSFPASVRDFVGTFDPLDYFKFTLLQISDINVNIDGLSATAFADLYFDANSNGLIDSGEKLADGSDDNTITRTVLPGTYFLEVSTGVLNPASRYNLSVEAQPNSGNLPADPGDRAATALDLGVLSGSQFLKDFVGVFDRLDFYKFRLDTTRRFNANIDGLAAIASVSLFFDANNNGLVDNQERLVSGSDNLSISRTLSPGSYFLEVNTSSFSSTRYDLTLDAA